MYVGLGVRIAECKYIAKLPLLKELMGHSNIETTMDFYLFSTDAIRRRLYTHGQLVNLSQLAMNMELSRQSVRKYMDILQETFMIRQLQPFHVNLKKRLVKSPKIFIRDSGVYHTLMGINAFQELAGHSILGMSWEGFCIEQILSQLPRGWSAFFYRTQAGAEVDLILQRRFGEPPIFIEFKYSL